MPQDKLTVVFCTVPDEESGQGIADVLVRERLAACVNLLPHLGSTYRWKGGIEHDSECLLLIKTRAALFDSLEARLSELHPYEVPEIVGIEASKISEAYARWAFESTGAGDRPPPAR